MGKIYRKHISCCGSQPLKSCQIYLMVGDIAQSVGEYVCLHGDSELNL